MDQFLSNTDVSGLPERLRKEGRCLDLCETFDAIVRERDWRKLPSLKWSTPNGDGSAHS